MLNWKDEERTFQIEAKKARRLDNPLRLADALAKLAELHLSVGCSERDDYFLEMAYNEAHEAWDLVNRYSSNGRVPRVLRLLDQIDRAWS